MKKRKCRSCKEEFEPIVHNGLVRSAFCLSCVTAKAKENVAKRKAKEWKKEKKARKERLKTYSEWLNDYQKIFNKAIRLRDKNKTCISCCGPLGRNFDAGHYFSVGAYPNLRFHEDNVHGQCVACNQHKHGNVSEYVIQLPKRIGQERFDKLLELRNEPLKLTIEEIKLLITECKQKVKALENG